MGAVSANADSIAIGALVLTESKGIATLKDVDSDRTITIDLSQIELGTSYKVLINV